MWGRKICARRQEKQASHRARWPHYVNVRNYLSHPSLVTYSFATPAIKVKLGQQIGGRLLIANHCTNHYDRPITNTEQHLHHIYTLFSAGAQRSQASYQPRQPAQLC
jgi:hypothetical protein